MLLFIAVVGYMANVCVQIKAYLADPTAFAAAAPVASDAPAAAAEEAAAPVEEEEESDEDMGLDLFG
jgi:large subunit ribosomal protein LP0